RHGPAAPPPESPLETDHERPGGDDDQRRPQERDQERPQHPQASPDQDADAEDGERDAGQISEGWRRGHGPHRNPEAGSGGRPYNLGPISPPRRSAVYRIGWMLLRRRLLRRAFPGSSAGRLEGSLPRSSCWASSPGRRSISRTPVANGWATSRSSPRGDGSARPGRASSPW